MFGRLSRPAVTRFAAARSRSVPARVNLGGVTLVCDRRSAARDAVTGASRRSPAVLKSQPDEFPAQVPTGSRGEPQAGMRGGFRSLPPWSGPLPPQYVHPSGADRRRQLPTESGASLRRQNRSALTPSPARVA